MLASHPARASCYYPVLACKVSSYLQFTCPSAPDLSVPSRVKFLVDPSTRSGVKKFVQREKAPVVRALSSCDSTEAPIGIEPMMEVLQTSALPLGYGAECCGPIT